MNAMHFALALPIAMLTATIIVGVVKLVIEYRNAPEGREDEAGFWLVDENERPDPIRVRADMPDVDRVRKPAE